MLELIFLGTGHAAVTELYNSCFVLKDNNHAFLVDGGGGNGILKQLQESKVSIDEIDAVFISHIHLDHLLGMLWLIRALAHARSYQITLYSHLDVIVTLKTLVKLLFTPEQVERIEEQLEYTVVRDSEYYEILGRETMFFDLDANKVRQFGFEMNLDGKRLVFLGDEPCAKRNESVARGATWMIHEAFCIEHEADRFRPHEKQHSTVTDAALLAERLGVENLILFHTEDTHPDKSELYQKEGKRVFGGEIIVPMDLERIVLEE